MTRTKHTPGEWFWSARTLRSEIRDEESDIVETPDIIHVDADKCLYTSDADGRLIAAAPELLEALDRLTGEAWACFGMNEEGCRQLFGNTNYSIVCEWIEKAKTAIAKATASESGAV